jgi:alkylation response protein AidB-like acyl-CoA dehydrogenase
MSALHDVRALVEDLERHLGDPFDPRARMTFRRILELDEQEAYPHDLLGVLHAWGAQDHAVPARWGGRAVDIETSLQLMRQVARRDATLATALSLTSLSYMPIWVAGTDQQRSFYARQIAAGAKMSWGLSERSHGSDVLANELSARPVDGGYLVSGEKWLIGNATLADHLVLHARTRPSGGPAGFSLLVLDKRTVPAGQVEVLAGERLHGLRGIDMSGFRLHDCFVPHSARIGEEGQGLEIALKAGHAVRSMITSIALGAADTGLRLTLDFAVDRVIFGQSVADIPYSRGQLVDAYADLLVADVVAVVCTRSLQVCPEQSSVFSAVSKYLVPALLQPCMARLAGVLGARHYLRSDPRFGVFQKALRDMPVADFADGNSVVNLKSLALQLDKLLAEAPPPDHEVCRALFDLDAPLPDYAPWRQALSSRGGADHALRSLPRSVTRLHTVAERVGGDGGVQLHEAGRLAASFLDERERLRAELYALQQRFGARHVHRRELFELARQYTLLHAAACVAGAWAHASDLAELPPPAVALLALKRVHEQLHPVDRWTADPSLADAAEAAAAADLRRRHRRGDSFALRRFQLQSAPPGALHQTEVGADSDAGSRRSGREAA